MIFSLRYPAGCSCFFLHLLFEKGEVNPARYEKRGSRKMACIMGCPAAHNNAALRKLPEQKDMEIVGRKNVVVFFILPSGWYFSVIRQMASACFLTGRQQGKGCYS
ncbi:hypothetical protein CXT98_11115 [Akkermansia muciniphila]|nr:hypothetical protein CXT98_11115 [Akkermansia muciniphila]QHV23103.1 hypothetical protein C5O13_03855 [Akkermansia muciniphila]RYU07940.1 hypothetical protein EAJ16_05485 [Akkermansia muciniphila]